MFIISKFSLQIVKYAVLYELHIWIPNVPFHYAQR